MDSRDNVFRTICIPCLHLFRRNSLQPVMAQDLHAVTTPHQSGFATALAKVSRPEVDTFFSFFLNYHPIFGQPLKKCGFR